jgi:tetratricopeptide (TPR) repeat protein
MEKTHTAATPTDRAIAAAVALWKDCRHAEAVASLRAYLAAGPDLTAVERQRLLSNVGMIERARGRLDESLEAYLEAARLDAVSRDPLVNGKCYNGLAATRLALGDGDGAIEGFTAASVYYEQAGAWDLKRDVENNLAVLHAEAGRPAEAMEHVARALGSGPLSDKVRAQIEDTRALVALAAGDARAALDLSNSSVSRLLRLDEPRLLAASVRTSVRAGGAFLRIEEEASLRAVLADCGWSLTRAAGVLGFNSREALTQHLKRHFPRLVEERRNRSVTSSDA